MESDFPKDWQRILGEEQKKPYFYALSDFLDREYETAVVYPPKEFLYKAFELTPFKEVKVVILGQDPYHDEDQAHGLCFSVNKGVKIPPSLRNIYKELVADCRCSVPTHGNLSSWGKQGVLLLNSILTVKAHEASSHSKIGWETFTDKVIEALNDRMDPVVFLFWGSYARAKKYLITNSRHVVIESAHPSPLSAHRGFLGSRPFSKVNEVLMQMGKEMILWEISDDEFG